MQSHYFADYSNNLPAAFSSESLSHSLSQEWWEGQSTPLPVLGHSVPTSGQEGCAVGWLQRLTW